MEQRVADLRLARSVAQIVVDLLIRISTMPLMRGFISLAFVCSMFAACATTEGGGGDAGGENPPPTGSPVCGDAVCAASEVGICSQDCGTGMTEICGNSKCEGNEPTTCASDCNTTPGGAVCGNGQCESTETNATCPGDCTTGGGGTCPTDPTECFLCVFDATLCANGLDQNTCTACLLMP
jgi:hypothetical protein